MVTNANTMSDRGRALMRTFAAALEAAREHAKKYPHETQAIHEALAAHLRSVAPLSMLVPLPETGPVPRLEPELVTPSGGMSVQLEDGSWYELIRCANARGAPTVRMYVRDEAAHDVVLMLVPARAEELRTNLARVIAAIGAKR